MSAVVAPPTLITAEEYLSLPGRGERTELRRGVVVPMNPPGFRHGEVCSNIHYYVDNFVRQAGIGRTLTNDTGIITERQPDTVRGADVSYYSFQRVPKDESPIGYAGIAPEIVFEVVSPSNTQREITFKIGEYINVGVKVVCVADSQYGIVNFHYPDRPTATLQGDDLLSFDDLPSFSLPVKRFFE